MRLSKVFETHVLRISVSQSLVITADIIAILFVIIRTTLQSGSSMISFSSGSCRAAIYLCIAFYISFKVAVQAFLIERLYIVRQTKQRRYFDPLWIGCMLAVTSGLGAIAISAYIWPIIITPPDGQCLVGIASPVVLTLLLYDVAINVFLTGVFIWLLLPSLKFRRGLAQSFESNASPFASSNATAGSSRAGKPPTPLPSPTTVAFPGPILEVRPAAFEPKRNWARQRFSLVSAGRSTQHDTVHAASLKKLIIRTLLATIWVLIPTIVNMSVLHHMVVEQDWLCLTICTLDCAWEVTAIHWVTLGRRAD
jgi:hypothetical protein